MSHITAEFVRQLAAVWHRFDVTPQDAQTLASMLEPMDDAGETLSERVEFDMEPGDFLSGLDAMAKETPHK